MSGPPDWAEIERILDRVLDLSPEERAEALARECAADSPLRRRIDALLAAEPAEGFLARPAAEQLGLDSERPDDPPPDPGSPAPRRQ